MHIQKPGSNLLAFFPTRRVQTESATGSVSSNKVRTTLTIAVEGIEFDTQACMLRVKGRNVQENQYVKVRAGQLSHSHQAAQITDFQFSLFFTKNPFECCMKDRTTGNHRTATESILLLKENPLFYAPNSYIFAN